MSQSSESDGLLINGLLSTCVDSIEFNVSLIPSYPKKIYRPRIFKAIFMDIVHPNTQLLSALKVRSH